MAPRIRTAWALQPWTSPRRGPLATTRHRLASSSSSSSSPATDPRWPGWIPTIGLELHVQLRGNPKLLSPEHAVYDDTPNTHVAPVDAALPGALPVLQPRAVRLALLACLAFNARINPRSTFDRKHYFYPDLTSGYQVTQRYDPLARDGVVRVPRPPARGKGAKAKASARDSDEDEYFEVRLEQIQLEQDTAKSFHDPSLYPSSSSSSSGGGGTLVDLNRSGAALIEVVTRPDLQSPEDAAAFVRTLQAALRHVGASGANMERGELRCDVNVSVARAGGAGAPGEGEGEGEALVRGTRCEVKNLNGVRFIAAAIESEIHRQIALLSSGSPVRQSTRGFNALTSSTFHLRSKEDAPDYRYVPDPELAPLVVSRAALDALRREVPELPEEARRRLRREYGLGRREAGVLVALGEGADEGAAGGAQGAQEEDEASPGIGVRWFEQLAKGRDAKLAANWLIHTYLGLLSRSSLSLPRSPLSPPELGTLLDAVAAKQLTTTEARNVLGAFVRRAGETGAGAGPEVGAFGNELDELLASRAAPPASSPSSSSGSGSNNADADLSALVDTLIASHPAEAAKVRAGHDKVVQRLVGAAMKLTRGKADALRVGEELRRRLVAGGGEA